MSVARPMETKLDIKLEINSVGGQAGPGRSSIKRRDLEFGLEINLVSNLMS